MKYIITTLGCKVNQYETQAIETMLRERGHAPAGEGGFGYDPVFLLPGAGKTFGQLSQEEKSAVSHRGKALKEFAGKLETYLKK